MPTVLHTEGFRFFFYSNEGNEPAHIHVEKGSGYAKYWLDPIQVSYAEGFQRRDIRKMSELVEANAKMLLKAWEDYFGD